MRKILSGMAISFKETAREIGTTSLLLAVIAALLFAILGEFARAKLAATWRLENGDTSTSTRCIGNWYAQTGLMEHLLEVRRAEAAADADDRRKRDA